MTDNSFKYVTNSESLTEWYPVVTFWDPYFYITPWVMLYDKFMLLYYAWSCWDLSCFVIMYSYLIKDFVINGGIYTIPQVFGKDVICLQSDNYFLHALIFMKRWMLVVRWSIYAPENWFVIIQHNNFSPVWCPVITRTNADLSLVSPRRKPLVKFQSKWWSLPFKHIYLKILSAKHQRVGQVPMRKCISYLSSLV